MREHVFQKLILQGFADDSISVLYLNNCGYDFNKLIKNVILDTGKQDIFLPINNTIMSMYDFMMKILSGSILVTDTWIESVR